MIHWAIYTYMYVYRFNGIVPILIYDTFGHIHLHVCLQIQWYSSPNWSMIHWAIYTYIYVYRFYGIVPILIYDTLGHIYLHACLHVQWYSSPNWSMIHLHVCLQVLWYSSQTGLWYIGPYILTCMSTGSMVYFLYWSMIHWAIYTYMYVYRFNGIIPKLVYDTLGHIYLHVCLQIQWYSSHTDLWYIGPYILTCMSTGSMV